MVRIESATHTGLLREHNEDRYAGCMLADDYGYALVCDGMGGENGGSIASTLACEEIRRTMAGSYRPGLDEKSVYMILESALEAANTGVFQRAQAEPELHGMGTTVLLAVLSGGRCYLANVGDSRAYLLRGESFTQLTVDHTRVQALVDQGKITQDEAKTHPQRHLLTRAAGVAPHITPSFVQTALQVGDVLLLCSDGLYNMVDDEALVLLLRQIAAGADCGILVEEANRRGGMDNITAVAVIRLEGGSTRTDG